MQLINATPPNFEAILKVFPNAKNPGVLFAYAPDIYYPNGRGQIPQSLIDHEYVHLLRQEEVGVEKWWHLYLHDLDFRYLEELLAHRAEYRTLIATATSRQQRRMALKGVAKRLSSPLYGNMVSYERAVQDITVGDAK